MQKVKSYDKEFKQIKELHAAVCTAIIYARPEYFHCTPVRLLHAVTFRVRPAGPHHLRIRAMMCNLQDIRSLIWGATSSVTGGWDV